MDGFSGKRLQPIIEVALARVEEFQKMKNSMEAAQMRLTERELIERAKGIIMKRRSLNEDAAYHVLRKAAMQHGLRIADVTQSIMTASELLQ